MKLDSRPSFIFLFLLVSVFCVGPESADLLSCMFSLLQHQVHATCFPSALIPPCLYSSSIQLLLVSADAGPVLYCSLMCVATPQIYFSAEGWLSYFLHG